MVKILRMVVLNCQQRGSITMAACKNKSATSSFQDHPDIVYLERYAHACCSATGEQRKGASRAGIVGCLFL